MRNVKYHKIVLIRIVQYPLPDNASPGGGWWDSPNGAGKNSILFEINHVIFTIETPSKV